MTKDELKECKRIFYDFKYNPYKKKFFVVTEDYDTKPFAAFIALCSDEEMEEIEKTTEMIYRNMIPDISVEKEIVSLEIHEETVTSIFKTPNYTEKITIPTIFWLLLVKRYNANVTEEKIYQMHRQDPIQLLKKELDRRNVDKLVEPARIIERQIKEIERNRIHASIVFDDDE